MLDIKKHKFMKAISKHFGQSFLTLAAVVLLLSTLFFSCSKDKGQSAALNSSELW
jgi:hypothetical protein